MSEDKRALPPPIITFDNTGAAETVDGKCGFRVPTDDYEALASQIARVRQEGIEPDAPGQWMEERFSMVRNYRGYIEVHEGLVEGRRKVRS